MTTSEQSVTEPGRYGPADVDNLWLHFSRMGAYGEQAPPVIVKGDGAYIWDDRGRKYLDGLAGLFAGLSSQGRKLQTGQVRRYALGLTTGVILVGLVMILSQLA